MEHMREISAHLLQRSSTFGMNTNQTRTNVLMDPCFKRRKTKETRKRIICFTLGLKPPTHQLTKVQSEI